MKRSFTPMSTFLYYLSFTKESFAFTNSSSSNHGDFSDIGMKIYVDKYERDRDT